MSEEQKTERNAYKINIEPDVFKAAGEYKYITSTELGSIVYTIFKSAFADFEGVIFDDPKFQQGGELTYSLLFNHGKYDGSEIPVAVKRSIDENVDMSSLVNRIRHTDNIYRNGDKYLITEDGKDIIKPLLTRVAYNNSKPNWGKIVTEYSERQSNFYYQQAATQYTKVSSISANRLASLIYGRNDKVDNDIYDYGVIALGPVANPINGIGASSDYLLLLMKASTNEVNETYKKLGYSVSASNIIRA